MTAAPAIKGWCPTLLSPMQSGDGWLARVKPSAGCVSAEAARLIADAARRHGNGHIDLTSRANLQIRGLSPRSAQAFAEIIIGAGLANTNPLLEAVRNVMASPLGPDDPSASFDSHVVARDIEAMLVGEPGLWALPSKFGFLVDGGGALPLADISCRHHGSTGRGRAYRPPRWRYTRCALRSVLARRNGEGPGARFPSPVCATEREAAPHARAGDGGRRGGDLRRSRSDCRPRVCPDSRPKENRPSA